MPYRASVALLTMMYVCEIRGRTVATRAFTPIIARAVRRRPKRRLVGSLTTRFPGEAGYVLFQLGLYRHCVEFLSRRGAVLHSVESIRYLVKALFELGEFGEAHQSMALWFDSPLFLHDPDMLQLKGALDLILGQEEAAVNALSLAANQMPHLRAPHQNLAARISVEYQPTTIDLELGYLGRLYDGYNFAGQRVTHVGSGHLGIGLYAGALSAQKKLRVSSPPVSRALEMFLLDLGIELEDLRILPHEWVTQIGHEAMLDILFRMQALGWWKGQAVVLARADLIANQALLNLFREFCPLLISGIDMSDETAAELGSLQRYCGMSFNAFELPNGEVVPWQEAGARAIREWESKNRGDPLRDIYDRWLRANPILLDTAKTIKEQWGMGPNDWFVCLHVRDAAHYAETDLMGQDHRNAGIKAYIAAAKYITGQGGWVIKLGGPLSPQLPRMKRVIEYGRSSFKSEMMDLYLIRHCRYFIGTTSGLTNVAVSFGIPTALVNCITTDAQLWGNRVRFALKKVRKSDGQFVTQREITSSPWRWRMFDAAVLRQHRATVFDNSSDEILGVVKEVEALADDPAIDLVAREPSLIRKWRRCLALPDFYGNARPSLHYLELNERDFLDDDDSDEITEIEPELTSEQIMSDAS